MSFAPCSEKISVRREHRTARRRASRSGDDTEHLVRNVNDLLRSLAVEVANDSLALERQVADLRFRSGDRNLQATADLAMNLHNDGYVFIAGEIRVELWPRLQMHGILVAEC